MKKIKRITPDIIFAENYFNGFKLEFRSHDEDLLNNYGILEAVSYWPKNDLPDRFIDLEDDESIKQALQISYLRIDLELDENNEVSSITYEII